MSPIDQSGKKGVSHWISGYNTWYLGIGGYFVRFRGLFTGLIIGLILLTGPPMWIPEGEIPPTISAKTLPLILYLVLFVVVILFLLFFYARKRAQRSIDIKRLLHKFLHNSRNSLCDFLERNKNVKDESDLLSRERQLFLKYCDDVCDIIANYYSKLVNEETVGCAVRMAMAPEADPSHIEYFTVGRGGKLSPNREKTSESIPLEKGIPKVFSDESISCQGVLFINDIKKAIDNGFYEETQNDRLYGNECKAMIVAPINGWNGQSKDLLGLLYITAKSKKILKPKHVDIVRFAADTLAVIISSKLIYYSNYNMIASSVKRRICE